MKPTVKIAAAPTPDGSEMVLYQHDRDFFIKINGQDLMHSRQHESELELARLGCAHLTGRKAPSILIGGLGMAPGANIGETFALFEPIHGSAPNRAGKQTANPLSMILSGRRRLDWLGERDKDDKCIKAAAAIEEAVVKTLKAKNTVPDLGGNKTTLGMAEAIADAIAQATG